VVACVLHGCSPQVMACLLHRGADAGQIGKMGLTAIQIVSRIRIVPIQRSSSISKVSLPSPWSECVAVPGVAGRFPLETFSEQRCCMHAALLLAFGADADRIDEQGDNCANHADKGARPRLAHLLRCWGGIDVKAMAAVCRTPLWLSRRALKGRAVAASTEVLPNAASGNVICFLRIASVQHRICDLLAPVPSAGELELDRDVDQ